MCIEKSDRFGYCFEKLFFLYNSMRLYFPLIWIFICISVCYTCTLISTEKNVDANLDASNNVISGIEPSSVGERIV